MMGRTSGWGTSDMQMQDRASFGVSSAWKRIRLLPKSTGATLQHANALAGGYDNANANH